MRTGATDMQSTDAAPELIIDFSALPLDDRLQRVIVAEKEESP